MPARFKIIGHIIADKTLADKSDQWLFLSHFGGKKMIYNRRNRIFILSLFP